ncbi:helix-turn-helix transcriptional regulator [uncultured Psychroserpens sp.]|uniref:helix-turn-helix domain-containing protein n=1 Tax=uncultured Psychroserpens sp. TaxID=255436 RepID=UPI00260D431A|nr:helix-turn-helix transcriptional regulator [uncultured Psychroserpens sp.]
MNLILDFFLVTGVVINAIILVQLLRIKKKALSQKILLVLFSLLFCVALYFYALLHNITWLAKLCFLPNDMTIITLAPLLLLYVKSLFLDEKSLVKNHLKHFTPAVLFALSITIPTMIFNSYHSNALAYTHSNIVRFIIRTENIYFLLYLTISLRFLLKHQKLSKYEYSNLTKYDLNWIKVMLLSALSIIGLDLALKVYESILGDFSWNADFLSVLAMIILVSYLGFYGINQSKVLLPSFLLQNDTKSKSNKAENKMLSAEKKQEFEHLKHKLISTLNTNHPYLDEDLTLGKLAQQISTTDKTLSTMLNQYMKTTFYDLINTYRVEAVKKKIKSDRYNNYNLFGIACECGFKSRTSFNRIFKKETGLSPSEFKNSKS